MKIRNGFVSNSSSSSFICQVCGSEASGMDMSLSEAEMYECENGHIFCESHAIDFKFDKEFAIDLIEQSINSTKNAIAKYGNQSYYTDSLKNYEFELEEVKNADDDYDYADIIDNHEYRYELPSKYCPICQMQHIMDSDMVSYLLKENGKTTKQVESEMQSKFANIDEFKHYLDN